MKSLIFLILVAVVGFWLGPQVIENSPFVIGVVGILFFTILALTNFEKALLLLLFVIPLSVQSNLGSAGGAPVDFGVDDFFIFCLFVVWIVYLGKTKQAPFVANPMTGPFAAYLVACLLSLLPMFLRGMGQPILSLFHLVKWYEYVFIYFVTVKSLERREQIVQFVYLSIASCVLIAVIQFVQILFGGGDAAKSATASFESNGILGAYYLFFLAIVTSFWARAESSNNKTMLLGLSGLLAFTLFFTFARGAYLGMLAALITLGILHRRKLAFLGILLILSTPVFISKNVSQEITGTLQVEQSSGQFQATNYKRGMQFQAGKREFQLDMSSSQRLILWQKAWKMFYQNPILGTGYWSTNFIRTFHFNTVHSQYFEVLMETGVLGAIAYIWIFWAMISGGLGFYKQTQDPFFFSLCTGYVAGVIGLLVDAAFGETFDSFRLSGPLWLMTGIVFAAQRIEKESLQELGYQ